MQVFKLVAAAMVVGCLSTPLQARAAVSPPDTPLATLTVTGQGTVSRAPDLATVALTIVTNDDNSSRALSENNSRYAALLAKLGAIGIAANDITSTSIQSYFNPRPSAHSEISTGGIYGFVVTRNVEIN